MHNFLKFLNTELKISISSSIYCQETLKTTQLSASFCFHSEPTIEDEESIKFLTWWNMHLGYHRWRERQISPLEHWALQGQLVQHSSQSQMVPSCHRLGPHKDSRLDCVRCMARTRLSFQCSSLSLTPCLAQRTHWLSPCFAFGSHPQFSHLISIHRERERERITIVIVILENNFKRWKE